MDSKRSRTHSGAPAPPIRYSRLYAASGASPCAMDQSANASHGAAASEPLGGSNEASARKVSISDGGTAVPIALGSGQPTATPYLPSTTGHLSEKGGQIALRKPHLLSALFG